MESLETNLRKLYPQLTDAQLKEADENVERYLEVVLRIFNRILTEEEEAAKTGTLTPAHSDVTMDPTKPKAS